MKNRRPLSEIEKLFVKQAEAGHFDVGYGDDGAPFALGEEGTDNLFKMDVESAKDGDRWCYFLPENTDLAARLR
jgi:hypothetical protein